MADEKWLSDSRREKFQWSDGDVEWHGEAGETLTVAGARAMQGLGDRPMCVSGGADGSDSQFGMCAGTAGHTVFHFCFDGHRTGVPESERVYLKADQLAEADPYLERANQTLGRRFPTSSSYTNNLLRRNYFQQRDSGSMYAVVEGFDAQNRPLGGTAWALQMFIDRHEGEACAAYVFDQSSDRWMTWTDQGWTPITAPPKPTGVWAGIGTRAKGLKPNGKTAIRTLLDYKGIQT